MRPALPVALLSAALASSLAVLALTLRAARAYYAQEQAVRLDPLGLDVHASAPARQPSGRPLLVMFGDSRVAMWTPPVIPGFEVLNLGVGNQTTAQARLRFDVEVPPLHPAVVLVQLGVNDLKTLPLFPDRRDAIVKACEANVAAVVRASRALGAEVVLTTIFSLGSVPVYRHLLWDPAPVAAAIVEVNGYLETLSGEGVTLVEAGPILDGPQSTVRAPFQLDYLHESPSAYAALDARVAPVVEGLRAKAP
jgi:lysophospholipase L1-like esterase